MRAKDFGLSGWKVAGRVLVSAGLLAIAAPALATEQAQQRQDGRGVKQDAKQEGRQEKVDCRQENNKSNAACRQDKRETKQDGREQSRDIKR